eukprot:GHVU01055934.1.p1 GENE.GHVU01055934.1~~GHVU01055934.1.p1  ORF type:complete len:580 (-),score=31.62 GHVU01055934.1:130-1809(-)
MWDERECRRSLDERLDRDEVHFTLHCCDLSQEEQEIRLNNIMCGRKSTHVESQASRIIETQLSENKSMRLIEVVVNEAACRKTLSTEENQNSHMMSKSRKAKSKCMQLIQTLETQIDEETSFESKKPRRKRILQTMESESSYAPHGSLSDEKKVDNGKYRRYNSRKRRQRRRNRINGRPEMEGRKAGSAVNTMENCSSLVINEHYMGKRTPCEYCDALLWSAEKTNGNICCGKGSIMLAHNAYNKRMLNQSFEYNKSNNDKVPVGTMPDKDSNYVVTDSESNDEGIDMATGRESVDTVGSESENSDDVGATCKYTGDVELSSYRDIQFAEETCDERQNREIWASKIIKLWWSTCERGKRLRQYSRALNNCFAIAAQTSRQTATAKMINREEGWRPCVHLNGRVCVKLSAINPEEGRSKRTFAQVYLHDPENNGPTEEDIRFACMKLPKGTSEKTMLSLKDDIVFYQNVLRRCNKIVADFICMNELEERLIERQTFVLSDVPLTKENHPERYRRPIGFKELTAFIGSEPGRRDVFLGEDLGIVFSRLYDALNPELFCQIC